jgi:hypothetical protein
MMGDVMEVPFKPIPSTMPNFISFDGIDYKMPVAVLTERQACEYAALLQYEFIEHWKRKQLEQQP